jgi:hypothetical protein
VAYLSLCVVAVLGLALPASPPTPLLVLAPELPSAGFGGEPRPGPPERPAPALSAESKALWPAFAGLGLAAVGVTVGVGCLVSHDADAQALHKQLQIQPGTGQPIETPATRALEDSAAAKNTGAVVALSLAAVVGVVSLFYLLSR